MILQGYLTDNVCGYKIVPNGLWFNRVIRICAIL
jgi:hypothetical protein